MSWFVFIILTILSWGIAHVLIKKGLAYLSPWQSYTIDTAIATILWVPYGILLGFKPEVITLSGIILVILLGVAFAAYYYVVEKGPLSVIAPIFSASPFITVLLSFWFLHESLTFLKLIAVFTTILGVILVSLTKGSKDKKSRSWIPLAFFLMIVWGIEGVVSKYLVDKVGNSTYVVMLAFGQIVAVNGWYALKKEKRVIPRIPKRYFLPTVLGVFMWNAGTITYMIAMERGLASLVTPLSYISLVITVILSAIYLKEKIRPIQSIGILFVVIGIILVSI